jgi:hypothetical protein
MSISQTQQVFKYNRVWQGYDDVSVELVCFRDYTNLKGATGLPREEHFWNIVGYFWPASSTRPVDRNPWAERAATAICNHTYLSISGASGSGKTDMCALYAIVSWLADPVGTSIMVSSTTLKESRRRIWGRIEDYWEALPEGVKIMGKLVSYDGIIKCNPEVLKASNISSIQLIPGEKRREKEATGRIQGTHNKLVILILDELTELSFAMVQAGLTNLSQNPKHQVIGIGNPASPFDPHGQFSTPKDGWESVTENDMEWETVYGHHIRFDARQSPNVLGGKAVYPYLPTTEQLEEAKRTLGENSTGFYRMWIGFWSPHGDEETIYSGADLVHYGATRTKVEWAYPPTALAALDAGYTSGGDRSIVYYGKIGVEMESRKLVLFYESYEELRDDATNKTTPRNYQIVRKFRDTCLARGIGPRQAAYDLTANQAFGDIMAAEWSPDVLGVQFGGKPSSRHGAEESYVNRVSEIWFSLRDFFAGRQIYGVGDDFGLELTKRRFFSAKKGNGLAVQVEKKKDMKGRTGTSPDIADAGLILLELARQRYKLKPVDHRGKASYHARTRSRGGRDALDFDNPNEYGEPPLRKKRGVELSSKMRRGLRGRGFKLQTSFGGGKNLRVVR